MRSSCVHPGDHAFDTFAVDLFRHLDRRKSLAQGKMPEFDHALKEWSESVLSTLPSLPSQRSFQKNSRSLFVQHLIEFKNGIPIPQGDCRTSSFIKNCWSEL